MALTLTGSHLSLVPLQAADRDALLEAAADGQMWDLPFTWVPGPETVDAYIAKALKERDQGTTIPFRIVTEGRVVGSTRFWKLDRDNRQVEIGGTWYGRAWQGSGLNTEAKFLMLRYAFEDLGLIRVQFTADETNTRSQAAILKLGAVFEGPIRYERIMPDGRRRNSFRYSLIEPEWPEVKARLLARLSA